MRPGTHAADDGSFRRDAGFKIGPAIAIIVVATVLAIVLLHKSSGGTALDLATATPKVTHHHTGKTNPKSRVHRHGTATTVPAGVTTTSTTVAATTTTQVPISKLVVVVANGTEVFHAAAFFETKLQAEGYQAETPANATSSSITASVVYFQPGYQDEAATLATSLGLPATAVQPYTPAAPVPSTISTANIIVLVGQNLASQVTAG